MSTLVERKADNGYPYITKNHSTSTSDTTTPKDYHHPAILALPQTNPLDPSHTTITTALIESLIILYDSNYTTSQFNAAITTLFHPSIHMSCAACQTTTLTDFHTIYRMQRAAFTAFTPLTCHITTSRNRIVLDMNMRWTGGGGRIVREVGTVLKAVVSEEDGGRVVELEEVWSLNDRLSSWMTVAGWNMFDGLRWLISTAVIRWAKWRQV